MQPDNFISESSIATDFFRDGVSTTYAALVNVLREMPETITVREAADLIAGCQAELEAALVARLDQVVAEHDGKSREAPNG